MAYDAFVVKTKNSDHIFSLDANSGKLFTMVGNNEYLVTQVSTCIKGQSFCYLGRKFNPYTGELDKSETFFKTSPVVQAYYC